MAIGDWTLGGLKSRVKFRLQNNPKYTDAFVQAAIKKAVVRLLLFAKNVQTISNANTFLLTSGTYSGKYAQEYPLPDNTLVVDSLTFDGQRPLKVLSQHELAATGIETNTEVGDPYAAYYYDTPERTKVVVLVPRPGRTAQLQFFGVVEPAWIVNDSSVPPFTEDSADALENYAVQYLTDGQPGEAERNLLAKKEWKEERAEFKVNQGINRVFRTRRERDI